MSAVIVLASEALQHKTLWNPTILGILVVLSAVGLFCGSVYMLLGTNLGARLGFLVAAAALSGWMVLLTSLWLTTATPLNVPRGSIPEWKVLEVIGNPGESKVSDVQRIVSDGSKVSAEEAANLRPALEGALVKTEVAANEEAPEQPFAEFAASTDFLTGEDYGLIAYTVGGGTKNAFWHQPKYAAVQFCPSVGAPAESKFVTAPPEPACDAAAGTRFVVLQRDLGSVRQPPLFYLLASVVLFVLSLLGLHWYERDRRARTTLAPVPASA